MRIQCMPCLHQETLDVSNVVLYPFLAFQCPICKKLTQILLDKDTLKNPPDYDSWGWWKPADTSFYWWLPVNMLFPGIYLRAAPGYRAERFLKGELRNIYDSPQGFLPPGFNFESIGS